jgi:hypothetical protein
VASRTTQANAALRLRNTLSIDPPRFLVDPAIAQWVGKLMSEERLVEYYLVDDPPGLMLLRSDGSMLRALILHRQDMAAQLAFANHHDAPTDVTQAIAEHRAAGLFGGDSPAHYFRVEPYPWQDNLVSVRTITGTEDWFIGIVADAPTDIDFDPRRAAYDAYLANL